MVWHERVCDERVWHERVCDERVCHERVGVVGWVEKEVDKVD